MLARNRRNQSLAEESAASTSALSYFSWLNITGFLNNHTYGAEHGRGLGVTLTRYLFMPIAAIASIFSAIIAWRQARLEQYQGISVPRAVVETAAAAAMIAAAVTAFAVTGAMAFVAPVILAGAIGLRSIFKAAEAIYYGVKASRADNEVERKEFRSRAVTSGVEAVVGAVIAASLVVAQVLAGPVVQAVAWGAGIVASMVGYVAMRMRDLNLTRYRKSSQFQRDCDIVEEAQERRQTSTARLAQEFGQQSLEQPSAPPAYQEPMQQQEQQQTASIYPDVSSTNDVAYSPQPVRYGM